MKLLTDKIMPERPATHPSGALSFLIYQEFYTTVDVRAIMWMVRDGVADYLYNL